MWYTIYLLFNTYLLILFRDTLHCVSVSCLCQYRRNMNNYLIVNNSVLFVYTSITLLFLRYIYISAKQEYFIYTVIFILLTFVFIYSYTVNQVNEFTIFFTAKHMIDVFFFNISLTFFFSYIDTSHINYKNYSCICFFLWLTH